MPSQVMSLILLRVNWKNAWYVYDEVFLKTIIVLFLSKKLEDNVLEKYPEWISVSVHNDYCFSENTNERSCFLCSYINQYTIFSGLFIIRLFIFMKIFKVSAYLSLIMCLLC